ncbi:MAG: hypothetical protein QME52_04395 [Bacteroidota bacterium]|nr:hypothetical protein [Bacteroidota bacterium]
MPNQPAWLRKVIRFFRSVFLIEHKRKSIYNALGWFLFHTIILYAFFFWLWSFAVPTYVGIITPISNKELQILGIASITKMGPSLDQGFEVAVYHREAAKMQDSLFDFKLESIHSHFPMLMALILATPIAWRTKIKPLLIAILIIIIIDSLACLNILIWSYTFLPDHNKFTPFSVSPLRDALVNFFYNFYNGMGVHVIPITVWILVCAWKVRLRRIKNTLL